MTTSLPHECRYRRALPGLLLLVVGGAVVTFGGSYLLIVSDSAGGEGFKSRGATVGLVFLTLLFVRWVLTMPVWLTIDGQGVRFRGIVTDRLVAWSDVLAVMWKRIVGRYGVELPGRVIFLVTDAKVWRVLNQGFVGGPLGVQQAFEAFGPVGDIPEIPEQVEPPGEVSRYLWLGVKLAPLVALVMLLVGMSGIAGVDWTPETVLLYSAGVGVVWTATLAVYVPWEKRLSQLWSSLCETFAVERVGRREARGDASASSNVDEDDEIVDVIVVDDESAHVALLPAGRTIKEQEQLVEEIDSLGTRVSIALWFVSMVVLAVGLMWIRRLLDTDAVNPVVDTRNARWVFAIGAAFCLGAWPGHFGATWYIMRKYGKSEVETYYAFRSWRKGRNVRRREEVWIPGTAFVIGVLLVIPMWNSGDVIDDRGISISPNLVSRAEYGFDDVASIELYKRIDAPIGMRDAESLVIRFSDGQDLTHTSGDSGVLSDRWRRAAAFIGEKSGVPITEGDIRPD